MQIIIAISLFLNFCWIIDAKSQGIIDERIKNAIDSLKSDTSLIYSFSCIGCSTSDSCMKEENHYLFWKKNDCYYVKEFDYCMDFPIIKLKKSNPLSFYLKYRDVIDKENIKRPTFKKVVRLIEKTDTLLLTTSVDHSYFHNVCIQMNGQVYRKSIDIYDLTEKYNTDGLKNVNYNSNRSTKTYSLLNIMDKFIKHITH